MNDIVLTEVIVAYTPCAIDSEEGHYQLHNSTYATNRETAQEGGDDEPQEEEDIQEEEEGKKTYYIDLVT